MPQIEIDPIYIDLNYPGESSEAEKDKDKDEDDGAEGGSEGGSDEEEEPEEIKCYDRVDPPLIFYWHGLFLSRVVYTMWFFGWLNCCLLCSTSARVLFKRDAVFKHFLGVFLENNKS